MIYDFSPLTGPDPLPRDRSANFQSETEREEPLLQLDNPDSQDLATADRMAREQIRVSGAHAMVYARTDNADFDPVFGEDPDPTYLAPVPLRCYFKPQPMELELKKWGVDAVNKLEGVFAISDLKEAFPNRLLRPGDVILLPYNHPVPDLNPGYYRVENGSPSGNYRYHWLYFTCTLETLPADVTVRVVEDMIDEPGGEAVYFGK